MRKMVKLDRKRNQNEEDLRTLPGREIFLCEKTTSLDMNVVLVAKSNNLYLLYLTEHPRKTACIDREENFMR